MPNTDVETDGRNDYLERESLLPDEQKGCRRKSQLQKISF